LWRTSQRHSAWLSVWPAAAWDVAAWARNHATFPHDSTAQQLYGDREFEAYRRLGELGGERALALLGGDDQAADKAAAQEKARDRAKESARQKASVKPRAAKKIDLTDKADSASTVTTPAMPAQSTASPESQQTPTHAS